MRAASSVGKPRLPPSQLPPPGEQLGVWGQDGGYNPSNISWASLGSGHAQNISPPSHPLLETHYPDCWSGQPPLQGDIALLNLLFLNQGTNWSQRKWWITLEKQRCLNTQMEPKSLQTLQKLCSCQRFRSHKSQLLKLFIAQNSWNVIELQAGDAFLLFLFLTW